MHLILLREGPTGQQVLLSRRAGGVYASGMWHLPSGHLDGPHEDVIDGGWRELLEETGVRTGRADVQAGVTVHHRAPAGAARIGVFLVIRVWEGEPEITEPELCDGMDWFGWQALPEPMVAYCRAGLDAYRAGARLAVHFQEPGDPIAYDPAVDRLYIVPDAPLQDDAERPEEAVRVFAEQAVGRITHWADSSWPREESQVWRATGARGGAWYVKRHQNDRFHAREVKALRHWVPALGTRAPRLVATDGPGRLVVLTEVAGRPLHGQALPAALEQEVHRQVGELTARYHHAAPANVAPPPGPGKLHRHLDSARPLLAAGDEDLALALAARRDTLPPAPHVPTHGDLQPRNILLETVGDGNLRAGLIDFERSELGPAVRDFVRLSDTWLGRPDLMEAFFTGYGRHLTTEELERLRCEAALDAVSGIAYGRTHHDPELLERGLRTLRALRTHTFL
ncbi:phosphotransferase [Streptomyces sp. NPDC046909]|uniref:phosphotransferase n=1 Tax=Streptomyces sp. NPDC046909 TaxID=3155617 RepID=UPI00340F831B